MQESIKLELYYFNNEITLPIVYRVLSIDSVVGDSALFDFVVGYSSNCFNNSFFL